MRFRLLFLMLLVSCQHAQSQSKSRKSPLSDIALRQVWVDSVYSRLNEEERIGQLFMVATYSGTNKENSAAIEKLVRAHQVGGLIFMQGGPARQALLTNRLQAMAQVPLLLSMDAEWGLGMRLDSVINLPRAMQIGATNSDELAYEVGKAIAMQCKRLGVHINFGPVVDVNNNPANPVINFRSFGEDKYKVTRLGIAYMRGMQENGIMACAKHFPGHGDVSVDSHVDMPQIKKSRAELDSLELYPFRELIRAGIKSVMVAHLGIPVLEQEAHVPSTLSKNIVTGLLKKDLGFNGLVFTDALDMKGVAKYYQPGEVDVRAFEAGNDVLLFSQDVPTAITKIKAALKSGRVTQKDLENRVKKILAAKWDAGLHKFRPISTDNIVNDINAVTRKLNARIAESAITVVRDREKLLKGAAFTGRVLQIALNNDEKLFFSGSNALAQWGRYYAGISLRNGGGVAAAEHKIASEKWDVIVLTINALSLYPGKSYGLSADELRFIRELSSKPNVIVAVMGNAYAIEYVCNAGTIICGYEGNPWTQLALEKLLAGEIKPEGSLPVTPPCLQ